MTKSIQIAGVGGQGILVAADIIAIAAMESGYDVKKSEIHGMSQRGGSVLSAVRYGEKVYSPVITAEQADVLLAFEKLEALRQLHYLKEGGLLVINDLEIDPLPVAAGNMNYPENILEIILEKLHEKNIHILDANKIAVEAGNLRTMNVALLGSISHKLPEITQEAWEVAIKQRVPAKAIDVNLKAFSMGKRE